jgi:hypothetical protein
MITELLSYAGGSTKTERLCCCSPAKRPKDGPLGGFKRLLRCLRCRSAEAALGFCGVWVNFAAQTCSTSSIFGERPCLRPLHAFARSITSYNTDRDHILRRNDDWCTVESERQRTLVDIGTRHSNFAPQERGRRHVDSHLVTVEVESVKSGTRARCSCRLTFRSKAGSDSRYQTVAALAHGSFSSDRVMRG